jgi:formylglycine-generating enzyme required for sulfatase activity
MKKLLLLTLLILGLLVACIPDYDNAIDTENDNSVPPPPQELKLTAINLQAKVNGTFVYDYVNAKGIVFERRLKAIGEFTPIDTFETVDSVETFTDSTSLDYSTAYEYRLFAYNENGISIYLDTAEVTTGAAPDIEAPVIEMLYPLTDSLTVGVSEIVVSFSLTDLSIIGGVTVNDSTTIYDSTEARYSYLLILSVGKNSFTILAKDEFENTASKTFLEIYYEPTLLDEAAPLLSDYKANGRSFEDSIVVETAGTTITLSGVITDESMDGATVVVNDSLAAISDSSWIVTVEVGKNSYKEVVIKATDGSVNNNITTDTLFVLNEIDTVAPTVSILSHNDSGVVTASSITLSGKVMDNSGISSMNCRGTDAVITDSIWTLEVKEVTEGSFDKIIVQTRDSSIAQNLSKDTIHIIYDPSRLDEVAPVIEVANFNKIDTVDHSFVDILLLVTDSLSDVKYVNINGERADQNGVFWTYNFTDLKKNQNNIIEIEAMDKSTNGNISKDTITLFYYFDNQKPELSVTLSADELFKITEDSLYITTNSVTVTGSVTDESGIKNVLVNSYSVEVNNGKFSTTRTLDAYDNWMKVEVVAIDNSPQFAEATNRDTLTRWVRWDSTYNDHTKPTLTVTSHLTDDSKKTGEGLVTISGKAFDGSSISEIRVNGALASYDEADSSWAVADVAITTDSDGDVTPIKVIAIDNSTHLNKDSVEFDIVFDVSKVGNIDVDGPTITVSYDGGGVIGSKEITEDNIDLTARANDQESGVKSFVVSINGGVAIDLLASSNGESKNYTFTKYSNEMVFTAIDNSDITSELTFTVKCDVENIAPSVGYELSGNQLTWKWSKNNDIDFQEYQIWTGTNLRPDTTGTPSSVFQSASDTTLIKTISSTESYWIAVAVVDAKGNITRSFAKSMTETIPSNMVIVPAKDSSFTMGDSLVLSAAYAVTPEFTVNFTYDFGMDATEVTQGDYGALMGDLVYGYEGYSTPSWGYWGYGVNSPVHTINWYCATLYCNARSKRDGKDTVYMYSSISGDVGKYTTELEGFSMDLTRNGYRLPLEAEWEYAYRAGSQTTYYWGDEGDEATLKQYSWNCYNASVDNWTEPHAPTNGVQTVGTKPRNGFGLYDMAGNVAEFCNEYYGEYDHGEIDSTDYIGLSVPASGYENYRVIRGGSFYDGIQEDFLSAAKRYFTELSDAHSRLTHGFRCVLPLEIPDSW